MNTNECCMHINCNLFEPRYSSYVSAPSENTKSSQGTMCIARFKASEGGQRKLISFCDSTGLFEYSLGTHKTLKEMLCGLIY